MKIRPQTPQKTYKAACLININQGGSATQIKQDSLIKHADRGLFGSNQKRIIHQLTKEQDPPTPFNRLITHISRPMEEVEIEFDKKNVPVYLLNHKQIYQKWIQNIDYNLSAYDGQWATETILSIGQRYADKQLIFQSICQSPLLYELYSRQLYHIRFNDNPQTQTRLWQEYLHGQYWTVRQQCRYDQKAGHQVVAITGIGENKKNKKAIEQFCKQKNIDTALFGQIRQQTIYTASNISIIPEHIESNYLICDTKDHILSEIKVEITIKEHQQNGR